MKDEMHDIENDGLVEKMRELANRPASESWISTEQRANLIILAFSLEQSIADGNVPRIVGDWAKARRYWCSLTGEALI